MLAALFLGFAFVVSGSTGTPDSKQAERIRKIEDSLLSPCCYGGQVSTHQSDIAFRRVSTSLRPVFMEFSEFFHLC